MQAVSYGVCSRHYNPLLSASLLFWSRLVHADLAMHATLAALGTLPRARLLTRSRASIAPIQPTTTTAATIAAPKLRSWPLSSSLRYLGTVGGPQQTGRCKKQGCDWGACGRPRRRDLATSLALRGRVGADPHAGEALATEGYCWAQASRRDEAYRRRNRRKTALGR